MTASGSTSPDAPQFPLPLPAWLKPYITGYNLFVAAVIGLITAVFVVAVLLIILVSLNFNPLGFVE